MTDRISCCVPFCRRTHANPIGWVEWICQKHWVLVDKTVKRRRSLIHRRLKKTHDIDRCGRLYAADLKLWEKAMKQAIERAMGI
jgi:hypothetical protein